MIYSDIVNRQFSLFLQRISYYESCNRQVGMLFEEGRDTERSSDSSHKTQSRLHRSTASNWSSHSLAASHIHKLFSERIQIFAPVEFSKASILTGVIKISLKVSIFFVNSVIKNTFVKQDLHLHSSLVKRSSYSCGS